MTSSEGPRQRVLSLDLDFFLDHVKLWQGTGRLSPAEFSPWPREDVRRFVEERLGLSRVAPIPGRLAVHHDAAFHWWRQLIETGQLRAPFDVVHVDAHADLGMGDSGFLEIMGRLMWLAVGERAATARGVEEGNFLAYAAACGWISSLTYIPHDEWNGRDLHFMHFLDYDDRSGFLELKRIDDTRLRREVDRYNCYVRPYESEGTIPFRVSKWRDHRETAPFDFVFICQSPEYTPEAADALLPLLVAYAKTDQDLS